MAGGGLSRAKWEYKQARAVKMKAMDEDIKGFMDSMIGVTNRTSFYYLATRFISARLIIVAAKILELAARKAPYETGELRNSGEVRIVAGNITGMDTFVKIEGGETKEPKAVILKDYISKPSGRIEMNISFDREDKGRDVALWAHEELLDYVKRPKTGSQIGSWYARHFRTGPKYLERAFKVHKDKIPREIQRGLNDAIKAYNAKHKTRARRRGR